jgi:type I restriction enzyme R subunit
MDSSRFQTFDPTQSWSIAERRLPHWDQAGTLCFITWRTADSMPREVARRWAAERDEIVGRFLRQPLLASKLRSTGNLNTETACFEETRLQSSLAHLPWATQQQIRLQLAECFDWHLDVGHGACLLRRRELALIVSESLLKFDGDRYDLTDFVVMPNHVHLLAAFASEGAALQQCAAWKRWTARRINELTNGHDHFWQEDGFDHLVRSLDYFEHYRRYIANNGPHANLPITDFLHYSKS